MKTDKCEIQPSDSEQLWNALRDLLAKVGNVMPNVRRQDGEYTGLPRYMIAELDEARSRANDVLSETRIRVMP